MMYKKTIVSVTYTDDWNKKQIPEGKEVIELRIKKEKKIKHFVNKENLMFYMRKHDLDHCDCYIKKVYGETITHEGEVT